MTNKNIGIFFGIFLFAMFCMFILPSMCINKDLNNMYIAKEDEENCNQCKG